MKFRAFLISALIAVLLLNSACGTPAVAPPSDPQPAETAAPEPTPEPTPEPMDDTEKFNAYVSVANMLTDRMELCLTGYENRICVLDKDYSVNKKKFNGWINSIGDSEKKRVATAAEYAELAPSMEPVDGKLLALAPVALDMLDTLSKVYDYYETKGYVDDDFQKGEQMHQALMALIGDYSELAGEYLDAVNVMSHERVIKQLDVFKDDGRMLLYYSNVFILEAEDICNYLLSLEQVKNNMQIDPAEYRALYDTLAATHREFSGFANDEQAEKEGIRSLFSMFKRSVDECKAAAAKIAQQLDNGEKVSASDANKVIDKYSEVIDNYNRMI